MKIQILVDSERIWYNDYAPDLNQSLRKMGHASEIIRTHEEIIHGDILLLLSCTKILPSPFLKFHKKNIVVHASSLPKGRGNSPLTWQILESKNQIPICLFEVGKGVDTGPIYIRDQLILNGTELIDKIRHKLAKKINTMVNTFLESYDNIHPEDQIGEPTYYRRRTPDDSELDINKTIKVQFNLLRIVDNSSYPAFFRYMGKKYNLKIEEEK